MTEISFARSFLSALDGRPIKISSDHVTDAKKLPGSLSYTLPKYPQSPSFSAPSSTIAPADGNAAATQNTGTQISLRNLKSPTHSLTVSLPADQTSIYDLKSAYSSKFNVPAEKIKVLDLSNKRPISDSKLASEFITDGKDDVEFGIMLLGGVTPTISENAAAIAVTGATGAGLAEKPVEKSKSEEDVDMKDAETTTNVLATDEFWNDLKEWLDEKVGKDQGEKLTEVFKKAVGR